MTHALWPAPVVQADATLESKDANGEGLDLELKLVRDQRRDAIRSQLRVIAPEGAAGSVFEVSSSPGTPLRREVYLAPMRRTRELTGLRRTDSFLGSEFSYEDLEIAAPRESEWRHVEHSEENDRRVVRVTSGPYASYERVEVMLDAATALPLRVSFFDWEGALYKTETFGEIQTVDGHPMPTRIEMDDVQGGGKSVLRLRNIKLGGPLDEKLFSESPLRKGPPPAH